MSVAVLYAQSGERSDPLQTTHRSGKDNSLSLRPFAERNKEKMITT